MSDRLAALAELAYLNQPPKTHLRDAVWGGVPLGERELALLDTPAFQRLRRIQQLGFLSWVFPGAHHTRFEHSIGVFHLTRRALLQLLQRYSDAPLGPTDVRAGLAAALLHDVGHYPFSHAVEDLGHPLTRPHEEIGVELVQQTAIAQQLVTVWEVSPTRVARLLARDAPHLEPSDRILRELLSGALDTDKLDYLVRDAHYCHVPYGLVDVDRLIQSLGLWRDPAGENGGAWRLIVDDHGIGPLQSLIFAKYLMYDNVYWHHAARIATMMFSRALQDALDAGIITPSELEPADDASLLALLAERAPTGSTTASLVDALWQRHLYKRAVTLTPDDPSFAQLARLKSNPTARRAVEQRWCALLQPLVSRPLVGHEVLIDVPEVRDFVVPIEVLTNEPLHLRDESLPTGRPMSGPVPWSVVSGLSGQDMARYQRFMQRIRVIASDTALARTVRAAWPRLREELAGVNPHPA